MPNLCLCVGNEQAAQNQSPVLDSLREYDLTKGTQLDSKLSAWQGRQMAISHIRPCSTTANSKGPTVRGTQGGHCVPAATKSTDTMTSLWLCLIYKDYEGSTLNKHNDQHDVLSWNKDNISITVMSGLVLSQGRTAELCNQKRGKLCFKFFCSILCTFHWCFQAVRQLCGNTTSS